MTSIGDSIGYLLNISAKMIKRKLDDQLKQYNLTTGQWAVLKLLSADNHLSQAEIALRLNSDRATCGTIIDKLISKGYVEKELSKSDKRSYLVSITKPVEQIIDTLTTLAEQTNMQALANFTDADVEVLTEYLSKIVANLKDENAAG